MENIMHTIDRASDEDSANSDTTVVSNLAAKKNPPPKRIPTIDQFIPVAEQVIVESEERLSAFPRNYTEEIEVQHLTVQDTVHVAETFLYKKIHVEDDKIPQVVKKLWHINNRYNYRQRQAEKRSAQVSPQHVPISQPSPIPVNPQTSPI